MNNVFYITGNEAYLKDEALLKTKAKVLGEKYDQADLRTYYGAEVKMREVADFLKTAPFLSPCRLVIIKAADKLKAGEKEILKSYLKDPSRINQLIIAIGEKDSSLDSMLKGANKIDCRRLYGRRLSDWIRDKLKKYQLSNDVVSLLADNTSGDLTNLAQAIEKLELYVGQKKKIERSDVEKVIGRNLRETIFDLTRAISSQDSKSALPILSQLLNNGGRSSEIIGLILWQLRQLRRGSELLTERIDNARISAELKVKPFFMNNFLKQVRFFTKERIDKAHQLILNADLDIKKSRSKERFILEELIVRLCLL